MTARRRYSLPSGLQLRARELPLLFAMMGAGLAACSGDKAAGGPPPVANVSVSPSRPDLDVGETVRLRAVAEDADGNVLSDREAMWSTDAPAVAMVSQRGEVVGVSEGTATITASIEGKRGTARVSVQAEKGALRIATIQPDPMIEGQSVTITGEGFDPVATNNRVTVDGVAATVTAASATRLTISVPASDCRPARSADLRVTTALNPQGQTVRRNLRPPAFVNVGVGRQALVRDPNAFCLQFAPNAGDEAFLVGVQSIVESSSTLTSVRVEAVSAAAGGAGGQMLAPEYVPSAPIVASPLVDRDVEIARRHYAGEARFRQREREEIGRVRTSTDAMRPTPGATAAVSFPPTLKVGDQVDMRVPGWDSPCKTFVPIKAVVRRIGTRHIWLEDMANPSGYSAGDVQTLGDLFDSQIYDSDVDYFGTPTDIDRNGKIAIVITEQVNRNKLGDNTFLLGFVAAADLVSRNLCASSNEGEVFYGRTPDAAGTLGYPLSASEMMRVAPRNIAHEFVHIIQFGRRLYSNGVFPATWEAEGQASFAEEIVGHRITGHTIGQNYGLDVVMPSGTSPRWYSANMEMLSIYYGWSPGSPRKSNAPEQCSWLQRTDQGNTGPCWATDLLPYGVGWLFYRWLSDQFGPAFPGGEKGLHRTLVDLKGTGLASVSQLVGVPADSLMAQFAAMQYVDDRVPGAAPTLTLPSWNLPNALSSDPTRLLAPRERAFATFGDQVSVRGASTAYFRISGSGHAGTALRVRAADGAPLPAHMRLWVVRLK